MTNQTEKARACPHCAAEAVRHKERSEAERAALMRRLNRIEGQLRGIKRMVEEQVYCPDILIQVSAASAALAGFSKELLAQHLKSCVVKDIQAGREGAVDELAQLLQKLMK